MIAVTTSRELVAVPPDRQSVATVGPVNGSVEETYVSFLADPGLAERFDIRGDWNTQKSGWVLCDPGTVVAVVEQDHYVQMTGANFEHEVVECWRLTGFAKVAEVGKCVSYVGDEHDPCEGAIYTVTTKLWFPTYANTFEEGVIQLDLPHAEPGGLALRLERLMDNDHCPICGGTIGCQDLERTCTLIGEPVTVVDLVGELGRWER